MTLESQIDSLWMRSMAIAVLATVFGVQVTAATPLHSVLTLKLSQIAPVLPYLLLVLILIFRPKGLLGTRED